MIAVGCVGVFLGILLFFLGIALLAVPKGKKKEKEAEPLVEETAPIESATPEEGEDSGEKTERKYVAEEPSVPPISARRKGLARGFAVHGAVLVASMVVMLFVHAYLASIAWWIGLIVLLGELVIGLLANAWRAGGEKEE